MRIPILLLLLLSAVVACTGKTVSLTSEDGSRKLVYSCRDFQPQARSSEDLRLVFWNAGQTVRELVTAKDMAGAMSLGSVLRQGDVRRVEQLVVEHRCQVAP